VCVLCCVAWEGGEGALTQIRWSGLRAGFLLWRQVRPFDAPSVELEQYKTSAHLAARMLFTIQEVYGDIQGKVVADLGCGTGMLAIGSQVLEAGYVGSAAAAAAAAACCYYLCLCWPCPAHSQPPTRAVGLSARVSPQSLTLNGG
jgi:hypothetical protein